MKINYLIFSIILIMSADFLHLNTKKHILNIRLFYLAV